MKLALFDLDHTLLDVDSDYLWGEYVVRKGLVDEVLFREKNKEFYDQYIASTLDPVEYNEFVAAFLAQHSLEQLHGWRDEYVTTDIVPKMRPMGIDAIKKHQDAGHEVVIISATNDFVVSAVAKAFGINPSHTIATTLELTDNGYTGKVAGTPNFQAGKLVNLKAWLETRDPVSESWGYSDSYNDLPLLEFADYAIAVTPDDRLRTHALANHWAVEDWSL